MTQRYGLIEEFLDNNNSYKVGIIDGFVKADIERPFLYTTDILTCVVLLMVMDNEAWMIHIDVNNMKYKKIINDFLNTNEFKINEVYIFPGVKTNFLILSNIESIFIDRNIRFYTVSPFNDDRYSNTGGSIVYRFDKEKLYFFGIDSDGFVCDYDLSLNNEKISKK